MTTTPTRTLITDPCFGTTAPTVAARRVFRQTGPDLPGHLQTVLSGPDTPGYYHAWQALQRQICRDSQGNRFRLREDVDGNIWMERLP